MIHYRGKDIAVIRYVENGIETVFAALHVGIETVWEAVTSVWSCFANGYWQGSSPWTGDEPWNGFGRK